MSDETSKALDVVVRVPLKHLRTDPANFSARRPELNRGHVNELAARLQALGEDGFPPLVVWQEEQGAPIYVIDGHHRLAAYRKAGWRDRVPVIVKRGSAARAIFLGNVENTHDRPPMQTKEKTRLAWRYVREQMDGADPESAARTRVEIARHAGISVRSVDVMRETYRRHLDQEAAETVRDPFGPPLRTLSGDWWRDRKAIAGEEGSGNLSAPAAEAFRRQRRDRLARELAVLLEGAARRDPKMVGEALAVALGKDRVAAVMLAATATTAI